MAKFDLKFLDATDDSWIKCDCGENNKIEDGIIIITSYNPYTLELTNIYLDKSTAIKFAKTLRTEINKIV